MTAAMIVAGISLVLWFYLLLARGGFWRERPRPGPLHSPRWPEIVAVIPARDEAETIDETVASLLRQRYPGRLSLVLVDDHSSDGTAAAARAAAAALGCADCLTVIGARPLPAGWTGKMWAIAEGLRHLEEHSSTSELVLLTDADIAHHRSNLAELVARIENNGLDLASLMVKLNCSSFAECALIPAFVFFFGKLYPFAWVNDIRRRTAGAAGGCVLVRRAALKRIGGVAKIRDSLIDDCALAREVKAGGPIWLGLTVETRSLRRYRRLGDIWRMIARTAYTQLGHSPWRLAAMILVLVVIYLAPPILLFDNEEVTAILAGTAWLAMIVAFIPILVLYDQPLVIAPFLPVIALFYLAATLDSARRHWQGRGGEWKGRVQQRGRA